MSSPPVVRTGAARPRAARPPGEYLVPVAAWLLTLTAGLVAAGVGLGVALVALGGIAALGLVVAVARRPVLATYVYLATLPLIVGIGRGEAIPLLRPNELLLVVLLIGAGVAAYLHIARGLPIRVRLHPAEWALAGFVVLSTLWPVTSLMLRGRIPETHDIVALLPVCKLAAIYLLVRATVREPEQALRCVRCVTWPGIVVAALAILQTLQVGPVIAAVHSVYSPETGAGDLADRGSSTFSSSIATGDYLTVCILLVLCCGLRGLLRKREAVPLGAVLAAGILAAGQFSTWIMAGTAVLLLLWLYPRSRRPAMRLVRFAPLVLLAGLPAVVNRMSNFVDSGIPRSWDGRWYNLSTFYLPEFDWLRVLVGVSPDPVLPAPETWREAVYLESGYLQFLWIGGVPLLLGFLLLSVLVVRGAYTVTARSDAIGACATALLLAWLALLVLTLIDPHLTLRGFGDVTFALLAITLGRTHANTDQ